MIVSCHSKCPVIDIVSYLYWARNRLWGLFQRIFENVTEKEIWFCFFLHSHLLLFFLSSEGMSCQFDFNSRRHFPGKKSPFLTKILYLTFTAVLGSETDRTRIALCRDSAFSCSAFQTYCKAAEFKVHILPQKTY